MKSIQRKLVIIIIFGIMYDLLIISINIKTTIGNDEESGFYPATFSFDEDPVGTTGDNISFCDRFLIYSEEETGSTSASRLIIIDEIDGHKKVLKAEDRDYNSQICMWAFFPPQSYGSVEFWFRTSDTKKVTSINLFSFDTSFAFLTVSEGKWKDAKWREITDKAEPRANTWHHILIHFRCVKAIAYQGLPENKWKVIIDDIDFGQLSPIRGSQAYLDSFMMTTNNEMENYDSYIDAIGYSWDLNYNIGDNKDPVSTSEKDAQNFMEMFGIFVIICVSIAAISVAIFTVIELHKKKKSEPVLK